MFIKITFLKIIFVIRCTIYAYTSLFNLPDCTVQTLLNEKRVFCNIWLSYREGFALLLVNLILDFKRNIYI